MRSPTAAPACSCTSRSSRTGCRPGPRRRRSSTASPSAAALRRSTRSSPAPRASRAGARARRRGGHGGDPLHLGHHRPAEGRHADPSRHRPLRDGVRGCMGLTADDRSVAAVPLSHVTGLIANVAAMARCAGALVILPAFKAPEFLAARRARAHEPYAHRAGDVQPLPPAARVRGPRPLGLAHRRLWRRADADRHHRAARRDPAWPQAHERLWRDRDHLPGGPDAAALRRRPTPTASARRSPARRSP